MATDAEGNELIIGQPFNPWLVWGGIFVPIKIARDTHLSPGAKLTYGYLLHHASEDVLDDNGHTVEFESGRPLPPIEQVANEIGADIATTESYMRQLEAAGFIGKEPPVYKLTRPNIDEKGEQN